MTTKKKSAKEKYGDGTTYKTPSGKTKKRISKPGTKQGDAYCARSLAQKKKSPKSEVIKQRRKDWGCNGKKSSK